MERYRFRRGALVIVHSSCNNQNTKGEWVPEAAQTNDIGRLRHLLVRRGFEVVLEMGPNTDLPRPTTKDIEQKISGLATTWTWDDDHFDALIVIIAAHGSLDHITGWPLPEDPNKKSGPLDLADAIFSQFQLPVQDGSPTRASEALKGKPKVFITDACRITTDASAEARNPRHPLAWTPTTGASGNGFDGLPMPKRSRTGNTPGGHYDAVTAGGEALTRYTDFLFSFSTVPYNIGGMTRDHSCFLGCLVDALKATPTASLVDVLTAAAGAMPNKYARESGEVGQRNLPQTPEKQDTLRKTLRLVIQHSPILSKGPLPEDLFGRKDDAEKLKKALRDEARGCVYYLVLGSAGLGKTELVKSVGRALLADGCGARFSAIIFVELRVRDSETLVREAIRAAWQGAGLSEASQMRDALIILDNADDPYKDASNVKDHWFEVGLLKELEAHQPAAILITMRDEGQRSLFIRHAMRGAYKTNLEPLKPEDGRSMLQHLMNPDVKPELESPEEDDVLRACGFNGVSPLALTIVCGVLRNEFGPDSLYDVNDRSEYLKQLMVAIGDPTRSEDYYEIQKVMDISFERVPNRPGNELRRHFLELYLFPDQFTLEEAKALWPAESASKAKQMLADLKRYNLISETSSETGTHTFLMLDHIWVFAANAAEDPASKWLNRSEYASALLRLFRFVNTRWPPGARGNATFPRVFHDAKSRANKLMKVASGDKLMKVASIPQSRGTPSIPQSRGTLRASIPHSGSGSSRRPEAA